MGVPVSVINKTPFTWRISTQDQSKGYREIKPKKMIMFEESQAIHRYLIVQYGHDTRYYSYEYNTFKGPTTFTLTETRDRSQIEIHCTSENSTRHFPNFARKR